MATLQLRFASIPIGPDRKLARGWFQFDACTGLVTGILVNFAQGNGRNYQERLVEMPRDLHPWRDAANALERRYRRDIRETMRVYSFSVRN